MPPSTRADRTAALQELRRLQGQMRELEDAAAARRVDLEKQTAHMIDRLEMSRREISEALGVAHITVASWYGNHHKRST